MDGARVIDDDGGVRPTMADLEKRHVARLRVLDFSAMGADPRDEAVVVGMHEPVASGMADVEIQMNAARLVTGDEEAGTVYAHAF